MKTPWPFVAFSGSQSFDGQIGLMSGVIAEVVSLYTTSAVTFKLPF